MKALTLCLVVLSLISCVDQEAQRKAETDRWIANNNENTKKSIESLKSLREHYAPTESTAEDKAEASKKAADYYNGLAKSIISLDDGISEADTIARAAVSENRQQLIDWKRAMMIHYYRKHHYQEKIDSSLSALPNETQIDEAISMVLSLRKRHKKPD